MLGKGADRVAQQAGSAKRQILLRQRAAEAAAAAGCDDQRIG
jgi:hypothetical protein